MTLDELSALVDTMPERGIPCFDLSVYRDGEEVYRRMAGYADHAKTKPVGPSTLYWIFSASKVMTCVAAARLLEEGRIRLDDPVSRYLPSFAELSVAEKDGSVHPCEVPMTLEHLFTMTGGLDYDLNAPGIAREIASGKATTVSVCAAIPEKPLHFVPGTHYLYSLGHDVLGAIVEIVSGMRFSEYLNRIMWEPLGMAETGFSPLGREDRIAEEYRFSNGRGVALPIPTGSPFALCPGFESGGGGILTTVNDYMQMISALSRGGTAKNGYRLLKPETVALFESNRLPPAALNDFVSGRLWGYGWGLCGRVHMNPTYSLSRSPVGEFGWDGAAGAYASVDRKNRLAFFIGTAVHNGVYLYNWLHPLIRNAVYDALGVA